MTRNLHECDYVDRDNEIEGVETLPFALESYDRDNLHSLFPEKMPIRMTEWLYEKSMYGKKNDTESLATTSISTATGSRFVDRDVSSEVHGSCVTSSFDTLTPSHFPIISMTRSSEPSEIETGVRFAENSTKDSSDYESGMLIVPGQEGDREKPRSSESFIDLEERISSCVSNSRSIPNTCSNTAMDEMSRRHRRHRSQSEAMMQTVSLSRAPNDELYKLDFSYSMGSSNFLNIAGLFDGDEYQDLQTAVGLRFLDSIKSRTRSGIAANIIYGRNEDETEDMDKLLRPSTLHRTRAQSNPLFLPALHRIPSVRQEEQRSADRATVEQLGDDSYISSVQLSNSVSAQDVRSIISNPELLKSWFGPVVENVHVTGPSTPREEKDRVYDGEWIEASTSSLVLPRGRQELIQHLVESFWESFGFPLRTNISMFIERQKNQVVIKIGPYGGCTYAVHTFTVHELVQGVEVVGTSCGYFHSCLMVTDVVYLEIDEEMKTCCGLADYCLLPHLSELACQAAASLDALRDLVTFERNAPSSSESSLLHSGARREENNSASVPLLLQN